MTKTTALIAVGLAALLTPAPVSAEESSTPPVFVQQLDPRCRDGYTVHRIRILNTDDQSHSVRGESDADDRRVSYTFRYGAGERDTDRIFVTEGAPAEVSISVDGHTILTATLGASAC